jgi:hypothetical protein
MLPSTLLTAVIGGAVAVNGLISAIAFPKTIKSGEKFTIKGQQLGAQGYYEMSLILGAQTYTAYAASTVDSLGSRFLGPYDLSKTFQLAFSSRVNWRPKLISETANTGGGFNFEIPDVTISADMGTVLIRGVVIATSGVYQQVGMSSFHLNATIGTTTSTEYNAFTDTYTRDARTEWASN